MNPGVLAEEVERVRAAGVLGRSHGLSRLFDYLADPARAGRTLSEADVATDVFGRSAAADDDASVRVYVHRLRRKLEEYYAGPGSGSPQRLTIPVGEYRLDVVPAEAAAPPLRRRVRRAVLWAAAAVLLVALNLAGWAYVQRSPAPARELARVAEAPLWKGLGESRPVVVVVGDYYIFGDTGGGERPSRMVREFDINSPADLDVYLMDHPELQGRYVDLDTYYTPVGATLALRQIMPLVVQAAGGRARVRTITASQLTPEMMKSADIVYVGYLSALRLLQDPVFDRSRYQVGDTYDELVDRKTGQLYVSGAGQAPGERTNRDYGYLAGFTGPAGNRFVIVAGARDIGVQQTAEVATDAKALAALKTADPDALYAVEGVGRTNVSAARVRP
jgi:hypothetical protein